MLAMASRALGASAFRTRTSLSNDSRPSIRPWSRNVSGMPLRTIDGDAPLGERADDADELGFEEEVAGDEMGNEDRH